MNITHDIFETECRGKQEMAAQGALEYIIFLAVCSALLVFGSRYFTRVVDGFDNGFDFAARRILAP